MKWSGPAGICYNYSENDHHYRVLISNDLEKKIFRLSDDARRSIGPPTIHLVEIHDLDNPRPGDWSCVMCASPKVRPG